RLHLPTLTEQLSHLPVDKPLGLVVVGPDRPYSSGEIAAQFGVPCWAEIEWNPTLAAVLSEGEPEPRRFTSRSLMGQYRAAGLHVSQRCAQSRVLSMPMATRTAHFCANDRPTNPRRLLLDARRRGLAPRTSRFRTRHPPAAHRTRPVTRFRGHG